jgi:Flp pilus assembly protein TadG
VVKVTRRRHSERGQSLVEFGLILPVFVILIFGIIDFGLGLRAYITISQASREGARYGIVGNQPGAFTAGGSGDCNGSVDTNVVGRVCSTINGLDLSDVQSVSVTCPDTGAAPPCTPGDDLRVAVEYRYHYITPVKTLITVLAGGSMPTYWTISSTTTMRQE